MRATDVRNSTSVVTGALGAWVRVLVLAASVLAGGIALVVAVVAAGAGHGTYVPAILLFPYSMLMASFAGATTPVLLALAVAQYPLYGLFLVTTWNRKRHLSWWLSMVGLHTLVACATFLRPEF